MDGTGIAEIINSPDRDSDFDTDATKMTRAEFIMAQVDLDPIESQGSQEMSTSHFRSLATKKFLLASDRAGDSLNGKFNTHKSSFGSDKPPLTANQKDGSSKNTVVSFESKYTLLDLSEERMRRFICFQLQKFDCRMEYDTEIMDHDMVVQDICEADIADYCKYVVISCKMENEIPVIALIYLEKLMLSTGILLTKFNWQRIILICLVLASKIWDDDSLENCHFPKVMQDVTNNEINKLEQAFLEFIDYKLVLKGAEYAKYYFIMSTLAESINKDDQALSPFENEIRNKKSERVEWGQFPLKARIGADKMMSLQRDAANAEIKLKEMHNREFKEAYRGT